VKHFHQKTDRQRQQQNGCRLAATPVADASGVFLARLRLQNPERFMCWPTNARQLLRKRLSAMGKIKLPRTETPLLYQRVVILDQSAA